VCVCVDISAVYAFHIPGSGGSTRTAANSSVCRSIIVARFCGLSLGNLSTTAWTVWYAHPTAYQHYIIHNNMIYRYILYVCSVIYYIAFPLVKNTKFPRRVYNNYNLYYIPILWTGWDSRSRSGGAGHGSFTILCWWFRVWKFNGL